MDKTDSNIQVKQIKDVEAFAQLKADWQQLLSVSPVQSAFLTWEWLYAWWKINHENRELWIIAAWRDSQLVAIAPLMIETRSSVIRVLTNIGTPQADVCGFIHASGDQQVVDILIEHISANKSQWDILELNELRKDWFTKHAVSEKLANAGLLTITSDNPHYYIELQGGSWDKYSERLAKKFRHNLRRAIRLAEEIGPVTLHHYQGKEVDWDVFKTIIEINKNSHYPRLANSPNEQALIREVLHSMADDQRLVLYILAVNNQPVAYEYGFRNGTQFEDWRSGFDTTSLPSNLSIGKALAMKVVQACITAEFTEIDFLRGDEAYKLEWRPLARDFTQIRAFNRRKLTALISHFWLTKIKPRIRKSSLESDPRGQDTET